MITIIDYGMGNLASVQKAFKHLGFDVRVTDNRAQIENSSHLVLPGVGAAADAMQILKSRGLDETIRRHISNGRPFLGICLGMQLMLNKSYENGEHDCLGLISGTVRPFEKGLRDFRVPHIGWNTLKTNGKGLFDGIGQNTHMYFVHSYYAADVSGENIIGETDYGLTFASAIQKDNIYGVQFHPEKSGNEGLAILKNFGGKV